MRRKRPASGPPPAIERSPKRVSGDSEKLQKVLASRGFGSRRELETWIQARRVSVNGRIATLGDRVSTDDLIRVDGRRLLRSLRPRARQVLCYHKPVGEVCSRGDPEGRRTVFDALPRMSNGRWILVGRLDINTSGLLLLTDDGELAHRLMHPSYEVEREYAVRVLGKVERENLTALREGVNIDGQLHRFDTIVDVGGDGANHWYNVILREGKNREVRRLWEAQGVTVSRLMRVRYGSVVLERAVRPGRFLRLEAGAADHLASIVGLRPAANDAKNRSKSPVRDRGGKRGTSKRGTRSKVVPRSRQS